MLVDVQRRSSKAKPQGDPAKQKRARIFKEQIWLTPLYVYNYNLYTEATSLQTLIHTELYSDDFFYSNS